MDESKDTVLSQRVHTQRTAFCMILPYLEIPEKKVSALTELAERRLVLAQGYWLRQ